MGSSKRSPDTARWLNLRTGDEAERVDGLAVTPNFFEAVRIPLALGRAFGAVEAAPEREPRVAVISSAFWRRRFNAARASSVRR